MTSIQVKNDEIEFKNTNASNDGKITLSSSSNFVVSRPLQCANGLASTSLTVGENASVIATSDFEYVTADYFQLRDDSTNMITIDAPSSVTNYSLSLPSAQGSANTYLKNDGSGNLSFAALSSTLLGLTDTSSSNPGTNSLLQYNGSEWRYNTSISGLSLVSSSTLTASGTLNAGTISCTGNAQAVNFTATGYVLAPTVSGYTEVKANTINEYNSGSGVNVDSVLCKDSTVRLTNGSGSTTIGQRSGGSSALTLNFPITAPTAGQVLMSSDTSGNTAWGTISNKPWLIFFGIDLPNQVTGTSGSLTFTTNATLSLTGSQLSGVSTNNGINFVFSSTGYYEISGSFMVRLQSGTSANCCIFTLYTTYDNKFDSGTRSMYNGANPQTTITTPAVTGYTPNNPTKINFHHYVYVQTAGAVFQSSLLYYSCYGNSITVGDGANVPSSGSTGGHHNWIRIRKFI